MRARIHACIHARMHARSAADTGEDYNCTDDTAAADAASAVDLFFARFPQLKYSLDWKDGRDRQHSLDWKEGRSAAMA